MSNIPGEAITEEARALEAAIDAISNSMNEIVTFKRNYPNLPETEKNTLTKKFRELAKEQVTLFRLQKIPST